MSTTNTTSFLDLKKMSLESMGIWDETYKSMLILLVERGYQSYIVREWQITDIILKDDKVLLKWEKRLFPLTEEEIKTKYAMR